MHLTGIRAWWKHFIGGDNIRDDYGAKNEHNQTGKWGEEMAANLMRKKGYKIVAMNWKLGHLEVDVIAENQDEIVFVEVKTRTSTYGSKRAEEYVDLIKKKRIVAAANGYLKYYKTKKRPRFDIVGIQMDRASGKAIEITHIENAFIPPQKTISKSSYSGEWRWKHKGKVIK